MKTSEQVNELATAMAKAQGALRPALKDALNPHYGSKYADIAAVWEACRQAFPPNGLAIFQDVITDERGISVTTRIIHSSGQWAEFGPLHVPLAKQDAHGVGSACSYGRRYSLTAATGIVSEEDDDGNAAVGVGHHTDHIERGACSSTNGEPSRLRPTGNFGYGKKFVDTPWNVMLGSQLEWFRDAERTPGLIREKCEAELAWRAYEEAKAEQHRIPVDTTFDDKIPV